MSACTYLSKLEALEALYDDVLVESPADLPGAAQVEAQPVLARIRNKHAAVDLRAAVAFDASKEWMANGSRSAAAWLAGKNREKREAAERRVRLGRALRGMPGTEAALAAGQITEEHVAVMNRHLCSAVADRFVEDEAKIVERARTRRFVPFSRYLANWTAAADPDGADERARKQLEGSQWHASKTLEDMVAVDGLLDPIGGSIYLTELQRLCDILFKQDWAEAVERLGEGNVTKNDLRRTPAQRRAAAQVLMAERSAGARANGGGVKPVLNAVCDLQTLAALLARLEGRDDVEFPGERTCRLEDGTMITPLQALSIGLAGELRRLLVGPDGVCLDYGQGQRGFSGDLRTAVVLTHEFCGHDAGCDVPSWRCEIDHILPFTDGGATAVVNGDPKCTPHNRYKETLDRKVRKKKRRTDQQGRSSGDDPHCDDGDGSAGP